MAEYIEREKAIELIERYGGDIAVREIKRLPAENVRSERHGFWKECTNGKAWWYECSKCNHIPNLEGKTPFCLRCGAKMDGEDGDKNG